MAAGMLVAGGAGSAAAESTATTASCEVHIGNTYKSGYLINGSGSIASSCPSDTRGSVSIERWTGLRWLIVASYSIRPGGNNTIQYDCRGSGTQSWQTVVRGLLPEGYRSKISNRIRVSC
ncbi:hypothetical protein [Rhizohabitans arisaemae]|uniref:hypothetical protein n=1 Tax=Rhizohabitans arisaemae TaxID=2720610 RepID=UPI0024B17EA7|nr:hypothetical protein [Rhizohabitans arisaemae]